MLRILLCISNTKLQKDFSDNLGKYWKIYPNQAKTHFFKFKSQQLKVKFFTLNNRTKNNAKKD